MSGPSSPHWAYRFQSMGAFAASDKPRAQKGLWSLSNTFIKFLRLLYHYMSVNYTTIINNISDDFLLLDNERELLGVGFQH